MFRLLDLDRPNLSDRSTRATVRCRSGRAAEGLLCRLLGLPGRRCLCGGSGLGLCSWLGLLPWEGRPLLSMMKHGCLIGQLRSISIRLIPISNAGAADLEV